jgi:hypothetical protein
MPLPGQVQQAASSVPGFDCDAVLSADLAHRFFSQGYKFCLRYLSRAQAAQNLTAQETTDILNSGLALMPVQHARARGWSPDAALGQQDGLEASANAKTIGFPTGVSLWCDLEGVNATARPQDVTDYARAWHHPVHAAGYSPGLYVGAGTLLTGQQLFDLPFRHYWRSSSRVPDIPRRGYQLIHSAPPSNSMASRSIWMSPCPTTRELPRAGSARARRGLKGHDIVPLVSQPHSCNCHSERSKRQPTDSKPDFGRVIHVFLKTASTIAWRIYLGTNSPGESNARAQLPSKPSISILTPALPWPTRMRAVWSPLRPFMPSQTASETASRRSGRTILFAKIFVGIPCVLLRIDCISEGPFWQARSPLRNASLAVRVGGRASLL